MLWKKQEIKEYEEKTFHSIPLRDLSTIMNKRNALKVMKHIAAFNNQTAYSNFKTSNKIIKMTNDIIKKKIYY